MVRDLKLYPEDIKILTTVCEPVIIFDDEVKQIAEDLLHSLIYYKGWGLAAPQIGYNKRMIIVSWPGSPDRHPIVMVNPVIMEEPSSVIVKDKEGCLSLPGIQLEIARASRIRVKYYTPVGQAVELGLDFSARVVQHEVDHLDGILIIHPTRTSSLRRTLALEKYAKLRGLKVKK